MGEAARIDLMDLDGPAWVRLAGGAFQMGSHDGPLDTRPPHEVTVSGFRISRYPVTNAQYAAFVADSGEAAPESWPGGEVPADESDHPVTGVSWSDAQAFCSWLTLAMGAREGAAHLPTEAQWEFAARGVEGREFPWGADEPTPECANYQESLIERTTRVGSYPSGATPEGVHDVAGNVRQWCLDWYGDYADGPRQDPTGPVDGKERALRGGSYIDAPGTLRASYRFMIHPDSRFAFVGFRVAWS